ncbi:MAG: phosphatidylglycerophosphatase A [Holosporales bacterium]|nr:phosphatidylglycerophosphatase A [Holosporales bacterium]
MKRPVLLLEKIAWSVATCGGLGTIPKMPGTCGALFGGLLWYFFFSHTSITFKICLFLCFGSIGFWAIFRLLQQTDQKDPSYIVIDECLGQWIALAWGPSTIEATLSAFFLFRLFDIKKWGPIRAIDNLSKRSEVSLSLATACLIGDDLLAGICAGFCVKLLDFFSIF